MLRQRLPTDDCWWVFSNSDNDEKNETNGQQIVAAFLDRLSEHPESKTRTLEQFECWFFRNKNIKLSEDAKFHLVVGNNNNGLLFEVGSIDGNMLSSIAALRLLRKLLSPEFCSDAHIFLEILSCLDSESYLRAMALEKFFLYNFPKTRTDVFFVLEALSRAIPGLDIPSILSNDARAISEYENWAALLSGIRTSRYLLPENKPIGTSTPYTAKREGRCDNWKLIAANGEQLSRVDSLEIPTMTTSSTAMHEPNPMTISAQSTRRNSNGSESIEGDQQSALELFAWPDSPRTENRDSSRSSELPIHSPSVGSRTRLLTDDNTAHSLIVTSVSQSMSFNKNWWHWVRIPPVFEPYSLRLRYRRKLLNLNDSPLDPLMLPPSINIVSKKKQSEGDTSSTPVATVSTPVMRSGVAGREDSFNDLLGFSSDGRGGHISPFIVEAAILLPFSAALVAAILFDFRKTIAEALANPAVMEVLTTSQIEALICMQDSHWLPKIRQWEETIADADANWRVADFVIEASCPPKCLLALSSERVLTFESREGNGEYYVLLEHTLFCRRLSGMAEISSRSAINSSRSSHCKHPFIVKSCDKLSHSRTSVKLPLLAPLTPALSAAKTSPLYSPNLETMFNCRNVEYRVLSTGQDSCRVTFVAILPSKMITLIRSVVQSLQFNIFALSSLFSSELLGESAELFKAIWNIIYLGQTLAPFFTSSSPPSVVAAARDVFFQTRPISRNTGVQ